jgi:O-antigen biosynthesis protein
MNSINSIIIVAHNGLHLTRQTLKSALAQDIPVSIGLIDNASSDGTAHWARAMEARYPNVVWVPLAKQLSLAACWNEGLRRVWSHVLNGQHAIVLNNDVVLHPSTYRKLLEHGGPFVTTVSVDNKEQFVVDPDAPVTADRPHPNFSGFLIRKSCWDAVGPFNESYYPAYCEDAEYHVRMHRAGIKAVCIDLPMLHLGNGANTMRFAESAEVYQIKRGADRNRERFASKYGCKPGEPEYAELFSDSTFGIDRGVK